MNSKILFSLRANLHFIIFDNNVKYKILNFKISCIVIIYSEYREYIPIIINSTIWLQGMSVKV